MATFGAMVFLPVLLIVRNVVFLNAEGATAIVLNVLACIGAGSGCFAPGVRTAAQAGFV
mgnify:CR=1 FL=1